MDFRVIHFYTFKHDVPLAVSGVMFRTKSGKEFEIHKATSSTQSRLSNLTCHPEAKTTVSFYDSFVGVHIRMNA
jgi:hypothetical protein